MMETPRAVAFLMSLLVLFSGIPSAMMAMARNWRMGGEGGRIRREEEKVG